MNIIFVRHGKDDDRYRGGWSNLDLLPEGLEQAKKLASHLGGHREQYDITRIVSSDLQRAMTTANCISEELGLPVLKEPRLREMNNGDLAGMPNEECLIRYPGLYFSTLEMEEAYPNGESPHVFYRRICHWLQDTVAECSKLEHNILVVTHGGVISIVRHIADGLPWSNRNRPFPAAHCSIHILNVDTMQFDITNDLPI